ncbi:MAG: zf-HC2 domain-containing protein [Chloroflexia bacterium]|nr:zf-HC2 domain-containing protein [Chloroflexia bacterium]
MPKDRVTTDHCNQIAVHELDRFREGGLSGRRRQRIERHLATCPTCSERLRQLEAIQTLLQQAPIPSLPRDFTLKPQDRKARFGWYPLLRSASTLLALLVLLLFAAEMLQPTLPSGQPAPCTIALKPTLASTQAQPSAMVAPAVTRRAVPTVPAGLPAYPRLEETPWIRATVLHPQPELQTKTEPATPFPWPELQVVGLSLLALSLGLSWAFYRRERGIF